MKNEFEEIKKYFDAFTIAVGKALGTAEEKAKETVKTRLLSESEKRAFRIVGMTLAGAVGFVLFCFVVVGPIYDVAKPRTWTTKEEYVPPMKQPLGRSWTQAEIRAIQKETEEDMIHLEECDGDWRCQHRIHDAFPSTRKPRPWWR